MKQPKSFSLDSDLKTTSIGNYDMKKEWNKFCVGVPSSKKNFSNPDCVPFSTISHVSHIHSALSIIRKNHLSAGLVIDKSILNKERILVNWLSPNHWSDGFRYGNISFDFPIDDIFPNKNIYWIESIAYGIPACRILITDKEYSSLREYDPNIGDGPWWYNKENDTHYFNGKFCVEFMYENNLEITDETKISFVGHHPQWCADNRNNPSNCEDLGLISSKAGSLFISKVISSSIPINKKYFVKEEQEKPTIDFESACSTYLSKFYKIEKDITGKLRYNDSKSIPFARALFTSYANQNVDEFNLFASYFKSSDDIKKVSIILLCNHFNISDWEKFYNNL